jgi:hypothetical protein
MDGMMAIFQANQIQLFWAQLSNLMGADFTDAFVSQLGPHATNVLIFQWMTFSA